MSICTLIIGESGSGKSTSIRNLIPEETFIINILDKPLPFRGYKKNYIPLSSDGKKGNYYATDDFGSLIRCIRLINTRKEIKNIIIDDYQYVLCNEFMRRATERGYEKFTEIAQHAWHIIKELIACRDDLYCFVLSHSDTDQNGKVKCKTVGKLLDEKINLEGMFTLVLHTQIVDGQYKFLTQHDGTHLAKSPYGMISEKLIDNDLSLVKSNIINYSSGE